MLDIVLGARGIIVNISKLRVCFRRAFIRVSWEKDKRDELVNKIILGWCFI